MASELGKPADYGQFILERRYRLAKAYAPNAFARGGFYLDVGCGNGAQTVLYARHFDRWMGIDVEEGRLNEFRHFVDGIRNDELRMTNGDPLAAIRHSSFVIRHYDGDRIPLDDNSVDCLTCIEVIEHTRSDSGTISELFRVLRSGGTAIITVPNKWWIFETHGANLPLLPWNRVPFFSWLPYAIHSRYAKARIYRKSQIERLIRDAGFQIQKSLYVTAPMDMLKPESLQRAVRRAIFRNDATPIPFLSTSVMIVATKPSVSA
ncbi:MAG: class I SAM-dependent methyltransferase [Bacteroidota bacterium]|nr:class I SAM-dependent methyltransferase [Bacteroidota bacterium]MDP4234077.1 class I SAM-dependent methyltransferase [Bacteroidota bacterium]MDP4243018.1 class I SAM-dependent methyltransferase [Bacteroidota bacterium]MDP4287444.1 class I SAM-dependent methyltransferase [Bacteroidota bacterium]